MAEVIDVIDLFSGAGGISAGFTRVRGNDGGPAYRIVAGVDHDPASGATFLANNPTSSMYLGPIEEWFDVPSAEVVIGGPPCQGFSQLGSQDPDDPRNLLWREYFRVVEKVRPRAFVLENVARFRASSEVDNFAARCVDAGYRSPQIMNLNAADYGTPQRRIRTFVVGLREDLHQADLYPPATHSRKSNLAGLAAWISVRDALGELAASEPRGTALPDSRSVVITSFDGQQVSVPGAFLTTDLHIGRNPTPVSLERYRHIGPGQNRHAIPEHLLAPCWTRHKSGAGDVMGRLNWDEPSVTIRTEFFKPEKGRYLHPEEHRPITHMEAAILQGFPPEYLWCGSKLEIAKQIGNAVPVPLAEAIGRRLCEVLSPA